MPTRLRNVSSVALRFSQRGEWWMFDCGEATQHQLLRSDLKVSQLRRIFITHLHGDHVFGLMGLLASYGLAGNSHPIDVYGPPGIEEYMQAATRHSATRFAYPVEVHTVEPGEVYKDEEFTVSCDRLKHRITTFGYRVSEHDKPGHFDVEKATALGIPPGPLYGRLKRGEQITLPDSRRVDGVDLCGPPVKGRKVVYCTDTTYCETAVELARGADVLIHEATFSSRDTENAHRSMHSTTAMAAQVAREAGVRQLLLTHFSPRYVPGNEEEPDDLLREAQAIFPDTELAYDFMEFEVPRHQAALHS